MTTIVETCWGERQIDDKKYWHLVPVSGFSADIFKNNVRVGKGALLSVSAGIEAEPEIHNAQTPYSLANINNPKENTFEEIRQQKYPMLPSRIKNLYVFDDYNLVKRAMNELFSNDTKSIHECRLLTGSVTHKADTTWLNCTQDQWETYANQYWGGVDSNSPFHEILVHGVIYFPDWQEWASA
ncbi:MAG: DUF2441 domain-containing protein [Bacteroidetes bacterium]|nr:DUF2441 domain-containing protein [Bacteroidota bacterium]